MLPSYCSGLFFGSFEPAREFDVIGHELTWREGMVRRKRMSKRRRRRRGRRKKDNLGGVGGGRRRNEKEGRKERKRIGMKRRVRRQI